MLAWVSGLALEGIGGGICTVVGAAEHQDAGVVLQAVDLVEEVAPRAGRDDAIDVFEDEEAGGCGSCLLEDGTDGVLWVERAERFDIEDGHGLGAVGERFHHGFDGNGFAVTGRAVENESALGGRREVSFYSVVVS